MTPIYNRYNDFVEFDITFLSALKFEASGIAELDNLLQSATKDFLHGMQSFVGRKWNDEDNPHFETQIALLKTNIEYTYKNMLEMQLERYTQLLNVTGQREKTTTRDIIQNFGNETSTSSKYDPVVGGEQAQTKISGAVAEYDADSSTETTLEKYYSDNTAMADFFNEIEKDIVPRNFSKYINIYY